MRTRKSRQLSRQDQTKRRNHRAENIAVAVILTFCIVFALLININTHKVRKEKLATTEALLNQREIELKAALAIAEKRERAAQESLISADNLIAQYDVSLNEALVAENLNKELIQIYTAQNNELSEKIATTDELKAEHLQNLAEVKKLRKETLSMRESILTFYRSTKADKELAKQEIDKAQRAYSVSVARLNEAKNRETAAENLSREASDALAYTSELETRVNSLEGALSSATSNNFWLQNQVSNAHQHIRYHHNTGNNKKHRR